MHLAHCINVITLKSYPRSLTRQYYQKSSTLYKSLKLNQSLHEDCSVTNR